MAGEIDELKLESEKRFSEIAVKLQKIEDDLKVFNQRLSDQAAMVEDIQELSKSVALLASNMNAMLEEQKRQGARIQSLEDKPKRRYESIVDTILKLFITAAIGAVLVKIGLN